MAEPTDTTTPQPEEPKEALKLKRVWDRFLAREVDEHMRSLENLRAKRAEAASAEVAQPGGELRVTDDMVNRFLMWPLPPSVCADPCAGMSDYQFPRSGTHLLTQVEARAMLEYVLAAPPSSREG